jgi:hypothetical protein
LLEVEKIESIPASFNRIAAVYFCAFFRAFPLPFHFLSFLHFKMSSRQEDDDMYDAERNVLRDISLNTFLNAGQDFMSEYSGDKDYTLVARRIMKRLLYSIGENFVDAYHPFQKYASPENVSANIKRLAVDIMTESQEHRIRSVVVSFFHSGGANRDALEDLLMVFWHHSDVCLDRVDTDDDSDDDDDDDDDEDDDNDSQL